MTYTPGNKFAIVITMGDSYAVQHDRRLQSSVLTSARDEWQTVTGSQKWIPSTFRHLYTVTLRRLELCWIKLQVFGEAFGVSVWIFRCLCVAKLVPDLFILDCVTIVFVSTTIKYQVVCLMLTCPIRTAGCDSLTSIPFLERRSNRDDDIDQKYPFPSTEQRVFGFVLFT